MKLLKKIIIIVTLLALPFFTFAGCNTLDNEGIPPKEDKDDERKDDKEEEIKRDPIKEKIDSMTIDEKIGQLFMVGIDGPSVDENTKKLIEKYNVGGIILFKRNIKDKDQLLGLINDIKALNSKEKNIPLFFSVDEEGGRVTRLPDEITKLPSSKVIGSKKDEDFAYKVGELIGNRVSMFGFNMALTPVLDINSNPKNPVIGDRSFGDNEEVVSSLGIQEMLGIKSKNVIPVIKHFPGHGDTLVDSHIGLPLVNHDLGRLNDFELLPFKNAIENDADVTMIAHILLPKIDPENPSTLSKIVIDHILRNDLNFRGVVMSDDLTMGAIIENYSIDEATSKALFAGNDILTVCHGYENIISSIEGIKRGLEIGEIEESRIEDSVYRILKLKEKYNISDEILKDINIKELNDETKKVFDRFLN